MLVNRRGSVEPKAVEDLIKKQTQSILSKTTTDAAEHIDRNYFAARSNDVANRAVLTLCVMGLDRPFGEKSTTELIESIIRDFGGSGRTYKSALIFTVADDVESVRDAARNLLAWEDIDDDEDAKKRWENSDPTQLKLLARNLGNAKRDLGEVIFRAYRHIYLLGKDNKLQHVDLGQITSSSAASHVELILRHLSPPDIVVEGVSPNKLLKYWPPALVEWSTQSVRDAFYSSPQLPRLLNPEAIKRTICDGVTQGAFGYASKDANDKLKVEKLKVSLFDTEVEIADDVYIIKEADARKLLEPPKLAKLAIRPENVVLRIGEQAAFSCAAVDQYDQPFRTPPVKWSGTGGEVTTEGLFTAGQSGGYYTVRVEADGCEALAEIRITTKDEPPTPSLPPGEHVIRWRGDVPAQKWMNFYTKVLSKFATSPDLKLEVSFAAKVDRDQADAKASETKSSLRELGLDDDVSAS